MRGALLTKEGRAQAQRQRRALGPAPPGMAGALQQDTCRQCQQYCVSACAQKIIRIHAEDHQLVGLPYLDFAGAGCTFCGDCSGSCPVIEPGGLPVQRLGTARIVQERCLAWNSILCMSCISACERQALMMDQLRRPVVDPGSCNGCGSCVGRCPAQALEVTAQASASEHRVPASEAPTPHSCHHGA